MSQPARFDRLARLYCWMEYLSFGPYLRLRRQPLRGLAKHLAARVDCHDLHLRRTPDQLRKKPAIAIALVYGAPTGRYIAEA
jgi:hypothetical protein